MRVDAVLRFDTTFEYWAAFRAREDADAIYQLVRSDKAILVPASGGMVNLFTKAQMRVGGYVEQVRDRNSTLVFTNDGTEYRMFINSSVPQFDPYGQIIGYQHSLRPSMPAHVSIDAPVG